MKNAKKGLSEEEVFARHGDQSWGGYPYSTHLKSVQALANTLYGPDPLLQRAALLHDLLEDTDTTPSEVEDAVRDSVILLSRNLSQGDLSYREYIKKIARSGDLLAAKIKLADALANWTLSVITGDERAKRYEGSISILYPNVFGDPVNWEHLKNCVLAANLPIHGVEVVRNG